LHYDLHPLHSLATISFFFTTPNCMNGGKNPHLPQNSFFTVFFGAGVLRLSRKWLYLFSSRDVTTRFVDDSSPPPLIFCTTSFSKSVNTPVVSLLFSRFPPSRVGSSVLHSLPSFFAQKRLTSNEYEPSFPFYVECRTNEGLRSSLPRNLFPLSRDGRAPHMSISPLCQVITSLLSLGLHVFSRSLPFSSFCVLAWSCHCSPSPVGSPDVSVLFSNPAI